MIEPILIAHANGKTALFQRSDRSSSSWFGGPIEDDLSGISVPVRPHQIACLHIGDLVSIAPNNYPMCMPLIYPLRHEGGHLKYSFDVHSIEVHEIAPADATPDWPYVDYPAILPFHPLSLHSVVDESWDDFWSRTPNLPDDLEVEMVVLIPPPSQLGFTLWGRSGDDNGVTLVFECDLAERVIETYSIFA